MEITEKEYEDAVQFFYERGQVEMLNSITPEKREALVKAYKRQLGKESRHWFNQKYGGSPCGYFEL